MSSDFFDNQNNNEKNINSTSNPTNGIYDGREVIIDVKPKKKHNLAKSFTKIVAAGAVFGLVAGASFQGYYSMTNTNKNTDGTTKTSSNGAGNVVALETGAGQNNDAGDVSNVVSNAMPSIVAINSVMPKTTSDIFGREYSQDVQGSGSGIIIAQNDSEILIATNNHVVANAKSVEIVFADDTKAPATIKGTEPGKDLAVISVKLSDLKEGTIDHIKIATLGNSKSIKLGEMAIAIGNALGYGQSITVGYVSALNREVTVDDVTLHVLQTDAAINPGNSGGALLNSKGEVIGINSVKYVDDNVESIGYAIPITDAIPIINELMNRQILADGDKAYLGIAGKDVTNDYSERFNMPVGVYVGEIKKGSAAEKAGLKVGDIIVSVNNISVETMTDLQDVLGYTKAGSSGTVGIKSLEAGKYVDKTINVDFDTRPAGN
ncbi:trypsin-like peptidase domain-containing protein [Anaerocolumna sp. AGMB13025]|uniref:S1C family serine protease n=1 Tax=Anaerocolumna sp. AGMB13025 TaxID=3039116 RepID=UPI00241C5032|nr:trypsin-like peptidase domain-containing protein [Anaerocolumna sp. AGMB13025]WFR59617.1 trypsin-like peptidase domain-containing protein [Anaerocolumna sp. AGMB13025]